MITCERCNTENLDGSQYCDECGAVLSSAPRAKKPGTKPAEGDQPRVEDGGNAAEAVAAAVAPSSEITPAKPTALYVAGSDGEAAQVNGPHAKLVIHRGRSVGKEFPMSDDEIHIGRWDADGGIFPDVDLDSDDPEAKVSRRHARITRRGNQYYIEDLGSTNGTFINRGRRLLPGDRQPLRDGDEVIVGKTFLRFQVIK